MTKNPPCPVCGKTSGANMMEAGDSAPFVRYVVASYYCQDDGDEAHLAYWDEKSRPSP